MAVTIYKDVGFNGLYAHMEPGLYSGQQIRGYNNQSPYEFGEFLDNEINSIRVKSGTIAIINAGYSQSATDGRVIIGPKDISNLSSIGMGNKISSIQIVNYRKYDSSRVRHGNVFLYSDYNMNGRRAILGSGDYNKTRLNSKEVSGFDQIRSISVDSNMIAILYSSDNFDDNSDSMAIIGPNSEGDLSRVGIIDRVNSIRIYYVDPTVVTSYKSGLNPSNWPSPDPRYNRANPYPTYPTYQEPKPKSKLYQSISKMFETNKEKKNENNKEKEKDKPAYIFILVFVMILFLVVIGFFFLRKSDSSKLMFNQATANVQSAATAANVATVSDMVDI
jgi:hypothetical protein